MGVEQVPKKIPIDQPDIAMAGEIDVESLDAAGVTKLLNGIPGAYEAAQRGLQQAREGKTISLDEL